MHPWLAFVSFWKLLFGQKLPRQAAAFLPEPAKPLLADAADQKPAAKPPEKPAVTPTDKPPDGKRTAPAMQREGALALLSLLQREGRFIDFVTQPLDGFDDAQIGAAARDVHRGCRRVIDQHLVLEPVMPGDEQASVAVPKGFDPAEIRLIGEAKGEAPYRGTLRHHGWRVTEAKLPSLAEGVDRTVLAPAEVELSS